LQHWIQDDTLLYNELYGPIQHEVTSEEDSPSNQNIKIQTEDIQINIEQINPINLSQQSQIQGSIIGDGSIIHVARQNMQSTLTIIKEIQEYFNRAQSILSVQEQSLIWVLQQLCDNVEEDENDEFKNDTHEWLLTNTNHLFHNFVDESHIGLNVYDDFILIDMQQQIRLEENILQILCGSLNWVIIYVTDVTMMTMFTLRHDCYATRLSTLEQLTPAYSCKEHFLMIVSFKLLD